MRALALHPDVLVVTSAVLQVNCVIVRGGIEGEAESRAHEARDADNPVKVIDQRSRPEPLAETFVIDSPVLPDELDALPAVLEQARFPAPSGLLATHGDWDHLLGRLAFPDVALGCAESTAARLRAAPGEAQRQQRKFDEDLMIHRTRPLALGSPQALPVPGRCELGDHELELHAAEGHTSDGMAIVIPWAEAIVLGDYLSTAEPPTLGEGGNIEAYLATLEQLEGLIVTLLRVIPGHGPIMGRDDAIATLREDVAYLLSLRERGAEAELPPGRRNAAAREKHLQNAATLNA